MQGSVFGPKDFLRKVSLLFIKGSFLQYLFLRGEVQGVRMFKGVCPDTKGDFPDG